MPYDPNGLGYARRYTASYEPEVTWKDVKKTACSKLGLSLGAALVGVAALFAAATQVAPAYDVSARYQERLVKDADFRAMTVRARFTDPFHP